MINNTKTSGQLLFEELAINLDEVPFEHLSNYTAVEYFLTIEDEPPADATKLEKVSRYLESINHLANCQALKQIKTIFNTYINIGKTNIKYKITLDNYLLFQGLFIQLIKSVQQIINKVESNNLNNILILKAKALAWNGLLEKSCDIYEQIISQYHQTDKIDSEVYIEAVARLGIEQIRSGRKSTHCKLKSGVNNLKIALKQIDEIVNRQSNLFLLDIKIDVIENIALYEKNNGNFLKSFKLYSEAMKLRKKHQLSHKISFPLGHKGIVRRDLYNSPFYLLKF